MTCQPTVPGRSWDWSHRLGPHFCLSAGRRQWDGKADAMAKINYGSTDSGDADYDPELVRIAKQYEGKPVSLDAALLEYKLQKVLGN